MPAIYAHYRFGAKLLPTLPPDVQKTIRRFRRMFDVGLHGPDPFFYYQPLFETKIGNLGEEYHMQTGRELFGRMCRILAHKPDEASMAYLYGLLGHFCLDSNCHPTIDEWDESGVVAHIRVESEFERYLLEKDGKIPPCEQDLSPHLTLTDAECAAVAAFYPPASARQIRTAVNNMAFFTRFLTASESSPKRRLLMAATGAVAPKYRDMIMPAEPDPTCCHLDETLMALYTRAEERYPVMLAQVRAALRGAPLGEDFERTF